MRRLRRVAWRVKMVHRRATAGPWLPVESEGGAVYVHEPTESVFRASVAALDAEGAWAIAHAGGVTTAYEALETTFRT